jgi:hypothetical protein
MAHVRNRWGNRTRGPQLDQQAVEFVPFPEMPFCWSEEDVVKEDVDSLEVVGLDGSETRDDPLHVRSAPLKFHLFEIRGLGEVKRWGCLMVGWSTCNRKSSFDHGNRTANAPERRYLTPRCSRVLEHLDTRSVTNLGSSPSL